MTRQIYIAENISTAPYNKEIKFHRNRSCRFLVRSEQNQDFGTADHFSPGGGWHFDNAKKFPKTTCINFKCFIVNGLTLFF